MREADPTTEIHFIVDSPHFALVADSGFGVSKLPDRRHPLGFHSGRERRYKQLPELFDVFLEDWRPDVLLVDFLCKRALFEQVKGRGVRLAAVLRKQRPGSLKQLSMNRGAALVDAWLVPHTPQEWPLAQLPRRFRDRATYLGPVSRSVNVSRVPVLRQQHPTKEGLPRIVVTIGGGGAPESQKTLEAAEEALVQSGRSAHLLVVYGPNYPAAIPTDAVRGGLVVERRRFVAELPETLAAADLVISNAGYNTMLELRSAGTPAIIVPLSSTGRDDQDKRAEDFVREGRGLLSQPEVASIEANFRMILDEAKIKRFEIEEGPDLSQQGGQLLIALSNEFA
jgi:UDP-N-acetylglucosamine:LPS N-acetylglucosamine transferase